MAALIPARAGLLLIDLQRAIDDPRWAKEGPRNNPAAEANVARLLLAWRRAGWPVIHVRHDSTEANSTYRPGQAGHAFKPEALPLPGEQIVGKSKANAFIRTGLEESIKARGINALVIAGVLTNNSVEATARMAGDLGFSTFVVSDATFAFARRDFSGRSCSADEVHDLSLANLAGEYAQIVTTAQALAQM